jgi:hypothetical protein
MLRCAVALLIGLTWARVSSAQIYEWRDSDGSRHFTTDVEDLPLDQRQNPQVVVRQSAWGTDTAPVAADPAESRRRSEAQVVYDPSYRARRGASAPVAANEGVYIQGPLAVASVELAQLGADGAYPVPVAVVPVAALPLVTTSFDRGRSRHQTLRMLLQDQFQVDRDGPFLYERLGGATPRFRSFLPRGLPHDGSRWGRVVSR